MHKTVLPWMLALLIGLPAQYSLAGDVAPDALVNRVTTEVIAVLKQDRNAQAGDAARIADLVEAKILPHFDFARMTQIAMARHWRDTTPKQQLELTVEFRTLLVRTYSTALASYRDQAIAFKPLRAAPADTEVTVNSIVQQPGAEPLTIDYDLAKTAAGWKIFNVRIAGVSLVTAYRDTFASRIRESGVDGLIKSLADKNRQGRSASRPT